MNEKPMIIKDQTMTIKTFERIQILDQPMKVFALVSEDLAIHFWVQKNILSRRDEEEPYDGGVELHRKPMLGQKADRDHCWLLKGPCCHDGSTLLATERYIPRYLDCVQFEDGNFDVIFGMLHSTLREQVGEL